MGVVHVCKDTKKLAINSANGCGKGGVEGMILFQKRLKCFYQWEGEREKKKRTGLCGEDVLIFDEVLNRSHNIVNVSRCWEDGLLAA
jgi:hypothetical protein